MLNKRVQELHEASARYGIYFMNDGSVSIGHPRRDDTFTCRLPNTPEERPKTDYKIIV